jgi:hypothetical protein
VQLTRGVVRRHPHHVHYSATPSLTTTKARPQWAGLDWRSAVYVVALGLVLAILAMDQHLRDDAVAAVRFGADTANYWLAWQPDLYHGSRLLYGDAVFLYSPASAQAIYPLTLLGWYAFRIAWTLAALAAFTWMIWPARPWQRIVLAILACFSAGAGNIEWMIALVVVLGRRWPALWAIPLLTKVTPGVGLLWFAARREWRSLAIAIGVTIGIAAVSFAIAPHLWLGWIDVLYRNTTMPHYEGLIGFLPIRILAAGALAWIGGRLDRPELLLLGVGLANPDINVTAAALVCALPRLASDRVHVVRDDLLRAEVRAELADRLASHGDRAAHRRAGMDIPGGSGVAVVGVPGVRGPSEP